MRTTYEYIDVAHWNWRIIGNSDGTFPTDQVKLALLQDIRGHLKRIADTLTCVNAIAIPGILREIRENTKKPKRRAVRAKPLKKAAKKKVTKKKAVKRKKR